MDVRAQSATSLPHNLLAFSTTGRVFCMPRPTPNSTCCIHICIYRSSQLSTIRPTLRDIPFCLLYTYSRDDDYNAWASRLQAISHKFIQLRKFHWWRPNSAGDYDTNALLQHIKQNWVIEKSVKKNNGSAFFHSKIAFLALIWINVF